MKRTGPILLVAGTCIGSGMIALPLVLAKLGLVASVVLMLLMWLLMYYTSLINLELNLQAGKGLALGELGKRFSGPVAEWIGIISLKLLSYSLLAVFIYGGSSIVQEYLTSKMGWSVPLESVASVFALAAALALTLPIRLIDYCNRMLFVTLLGVVAILIVGLAATINWGNLPLFPTDKWESSSLAVILPVVFTSFGFQVIFHTLTNYCDKNAAVLKKVFFYGSLIPALVYILWTSSILGAVYNDNPAFYTEMVTGNAQVGELILVLSQINKWQSVQLLVWGISLLAIITSVIGVGVGLVDSLKAMLPKKGPQVLRTFLASLATVGPAYLAVIFVPDAFISVLGFAGMILAVIAVLLPVYLFMQLKGVSLHYRELSDKLLIAISVIAALMVVGCELYSML